jgi:hypothetical protein
MLKYQPLLGTQEGQDRADSKDKMIQWTYMSLLMYDLTHVNSHTWTYTGIILRQSNFIDEIDRTLPQIYRQDTYTKNNTDISISLW